MALNYDLKATRADVLSKTKIGEVTPMDPNDPAYNNAAFSGGGTSTGATGAATDPNKPLTAQADVFGAGITPSYANPTTTATTNGTSVSTGTTASTSTGSGAATGAASGKEDVGVYGDGASAATGATQAGLAQPVIGQTAVPTTSLAAPELPAGEQSAGQQSTSGSPYDAYKQSTGLTNQPGTDQYSMPDRQDYRDSTVKTGAAGTGSVSSVDHLNQMLDENSDYVKAARAAGTREGAKRGLLNSSMAAESGQLAAIKSAAPFAQQDAGYWQSRGLAEQKSGLDIEGYYVQGDISSRIQAEKAEYDRILSKQEAGQALTQQEQSYLLDYMGKSMLSSQEASQDVTKMRTKAELDAYLINQQGYVNSLLSAQEAGQQLTAQQQKAIDDYNTASALQQQEAYQQQQLELIKQEGANKRQAAELQTQKEIEQMNITSDEKLAVSNAVKELGIELDRQLAAINNDQNIPAEAKAAMSQQMYELYYHNVNMALAAYGFNIQW